MAQNTNRIFSQCKQPKVEEKIGFEHNMFETLLWARDPKIAESYRHVPLNQVESLGIMFEKCMLYTAKLALNGTHFGGICAPWGGVAKHDKIHAVPKTIW